MASRVPRIEIPPGTMAYCRDIAHNRNKYEGIHGHGVKNPNIQDDPQKSYRTHLIGAMAEAAVLFFYGQEPVGRLTWREDGKGGRESDLVLFGHRIEVKATERTGPSRLVVPKGRLRESDVYFLVHVDVANCMCLIKGWATWQDILDKDDESKPSALANKNLYTVKESKLRRPR